MALRQIRTLGDPVLEKECREVKEMTPRLQELIEDMLDTMYEHEGVGLAAPQVGVLRQIVVIDVGEDEEEEAQEQEETGAKGKKEKNGKPGKDKKDADAEEAENPGAAKNAGESGEARMAGDTGDAKRAGYGQSGPLILINPRILQTDGEQTGPEGCLSVPGKAGQVTRPNYVKIAALNEKMEPIEVEGTELLARAICHELDHLKGVMYVEKVEGDLYDVAEEEEGSAGE